jgi:hypothetical protein
MCGGLAPITLQSWHVIIALHAAIIGFAIWAANQSEQRPNFWKYFAAYSLTAISIAIIIGLGKPAFRKTELPREVEAMPEVARLLPQGLPIEPPVTR